MLQAALGFVLASSRGEVFAFRGVGRGKPTARHPLKKCPNSRQLRAGVDQKRTVTPSCRNRDTVLHDSQILPGGFCVAEMHRNSSWALANTSRGVLRWGKRCLLFPGQLLHFSLYHPMNKMQKHPLEQRADHRKSSPCTMHRKFPLQPALATSSPLRSSLPLA